jgi:hypothetical protein
MHEQAFEHRQDVRAPAEDTLDPCTATTGNGGDDQVAWAGVAEPLAVEHEGNAWNEERLADDELAALRDLDDDPLYT